jgi:hypothetical protein
MCCNYLNHLCYNDEETKRGIFLSYLRHYVSSSLPFTPQSMSPFLHNSDLCYNEQSIKLYLCTSNNTFSNTAVCK